MRTDLLALDRIVIPEGTERDTAHTREDETLKTSIAKTGIQQPLVLLRVGEELRLVDGWRRLVIARELGLPKVPVVVHEVPEGDDPTAYRLKLRFLLDEHRQNLLQSQRAELLAKIKSMLGYGNREMADYLGVNKESIRNWLDILHYEKEIVALIDSGAIALNTARVFVGLTPEGQRYILKHHRAELLAAGARDGFAKKMRATYDPARYPAFYADAKLTAKNLSIASTMRRKNREAPTYGAAEKRRLAASWELKEGEIADNKAEIAELKAECIAFAPTVNAILRTKSLRALVSRETLEELELFAEQGYA